MERRDFIFAGASALLGEALLRSAPAGAQASVPNPNLLCILQLPCCNCLNGPAMPISINTGAAPWRVKPPGATAFVPAIPWSDSGWTNALPPAGWITAPGAPHTLGNYIYELQFQIPSCFIPSPVTLSGQFASDNRGDLSVDSGPVFVTVLPPGHNFGNIKTIPAIVIAGAGLHTLRVVVNNTFGYTGLYLRGALTVTCPSAAPTATGGETPVG